MNRITQLPPFKRMCATIGILPSSYIDSMSYYETLVWLCNYLEKTVIPAINDNAGAIEELQDLFTQLQEYVDNYFENLDVQEEINNKLDDMVEAGTLQEIITEYLQVAGVLGYNTVADMVSATNLIDGSIARTLGNLTYLDGKGAFYKIRNITNEDVIDGVNIIAITSSDTLIAELIPDDLKNRVTDAEEDISNIESSIDDIKSDSDYYTPEMFGAVGDNVADDTTALQLAINKSIEDNKQLILKNKYKVTDTLNINNTLTVNGIGHDKCGIYANINKPIIDVEYPNVTFEKLHIQNDDGAGILSNGVNTTLIMCSLYSENEDCLTLCKANGLVDKCIFNPKTKNAVVITTSSTDLSDLQINTRVINSYFGHTGKGILLTSHDSRRPEGLTIINNNFINTGASNIEIQYGLHINISNNILDQASSFGVYLNDVKGNIDTVLIHSNWFAGSSTSYYGVYCANNNSISNINIINNRGEAIFTFALFQANTSQINILDNIIHGNNQAECTGISMYKTKYTRIKNNTLLSFNFPVTILDANETNTKFILKDNYYNGLWNTQKTTPSNFIEENNISII